VFQFDRQGAGEGDGATDRERPVPGGGVGAARVSSVREVALSVRAPFTTRPGEAAGRRTPEMLTPAWTVPRPARRPSATVSRVVDESVAPPESTSSADGSLWLKPPPSWSVPSSTLTLPVFVRSTAAESKAVVPAPVLRSCPAFSNA
jgi:hypothetical protein